MASPDHVQQKLRGVVEASHRIHVRPTVKGTGHPTFRSKFVRDLSTTLDLNRSVLTWSCNPPPLTVGGTDHAPDIRMQDTDGIWWMLDAFDRKLPAEATAVAEAATLLSYRYRVVDRSEIYDGFRLRNAIDLLRYAGHNVPLGDRVRLLAILDENGSLSFADCLRVIRETQPIAALASLIIQELIEVELDEALIGPETMVRRIRA